MKHFLSIVAVMFTASVWAQDAPPKPAELPNVPQVDTLEIGRMGNRVTVCGEGPRAGADVLFAMAVAPPEKDNDRWYITVWGPSNHEPTLKLVKWFQDAPLSAWTADPPASTNRKAWAHFNFIHADDGFQKWRFDDVKIPLTGPFPVVTINPPRNKKFGNPLVVVDRIESEQLVDPQYINQRINADLNLWTQKMIEAGKFPVSVRATHRPPESGIPSLELDDLIHGGKVYYLDAAASGTTAQAAPWGPQPPPTTPFNPVFPVNGPAGPVKLTLQQIQAASPDANAEFWLSQLSGGAFDTNAVAMAWLMKKMQNPSTPTVPVNPTPAPAPSSSWLTTILGLLGGGASGGLGMLLAWGLTTFRQMRKLSGKTLIIPDDASFAFIIEIIKALGGNVVIKPASAPPPPPSMTLTGSGLAAGIPVAPVH